MGNIVSAEGDAGGRRSHQPSVAIVVDDLSTWLVEGRQPTGIQRVVSELLEASYSRDDIHCWPALTTGDSIGGRGPGLRPVARKSLRWDAHAVPASPQLRLLRWAQPRVAELALPSLLRRPVKAAYGRLSFRVGGVRTGTVADAARPDLLLAPGSFWAGASPGRIVALARTGIPVRIVVHDLFPIQHPEWCGDRLVEDFRAGFDQLTPMCDQIVTLSSKVARDLADEYPHLAAVIRVATPSLNAHAAHPSPRLAQLPGRVRRPFLLAVGTVEPRKNHRAILEAWRTVLGDRRLPDAHLVIAGRRGWKADDIEREIAQGSERSRIIRVDDAADPIIESLYSECTATIHASWAEGFGLTVRESVARGVPTLASSGIPLDGLPDDSYELFDPGNPGELGALMVTALLAPWRRAAFRPESGAGWRPVLDAMVD